MKLIPANYLKETIAIKANIEVAFLSLGERLMKIRNERMWENGAYDSFEEFLHDAKLSPATASKLISIYQKFHLEWKFPHERLVAAGGWSVLDPIRKIARDKEHALELLEQAENQSRTHFEKTLKEQRTGIVMADCKHANFYILHVCKDCGDKWREYEESNG